MKEKLILFDIDGILINWESGSYDYWHETVKKHFGFDVSQNDTYTDGKTDKEILKDLLESKGVENPFSDKRFMAALDDVGVFAREFIRERKMKIEKIPNVEKLIQRLIGEKFVVGLLTGNTQEKSKAKLQACDLWKYFKIGAYGDVSERRSDLVSIAVKDAEEKTGIVFSKEDVFVVGDTVRDVRCAKEGAVKSIAVSTGKETFEMLKQENPDILFKDFADVEKIIEAIEG